MSSERVFFEKPVHVPEPIPPRGKFPSGVRERAVPKLSLEERTKLRAEAATALGCQPQEIALSDREVSEETRAYIGPLTPDIFRVIGHVEHIYTSFPDEKIKRFDLVVGQKDSRDLYCDLKNSRFTVSEYVKDIMWKEGGFKTQEELGLLDLVKVQVKDLGLNRPATLKEIYAKADELGLELCPPEAGPRLRLAYTKQPRHEWLRIAMKEVGVGGGLPIAFVVESGDAGDWLSMNWSSPDYTWPPDTKFVFRIPA